MFKFKKFSIVQEKSAMKVGTDGVLLGSWVALEGASRILDIGTGTGVIALMLAQRSSASVTGIEIDEESASEAISNVGDSPFVEQVKVQHVSLQDFDSKLPFDLLVCNPPFFTGGTLTDHNNTSIARHTIRLSHNDLLRSAQRLLTKEGRLAVVLPFMEGHQLINIAKSYGFYPLRITEVKPLEHKPIERLLIELSQDKLETPSLDTLVIQKEGRNNYTEGYIELTKDFYLHM